MSANKRARFFSSVQEELRTKREKERARRAKNPAAHSAACQRWRANNREKVLAEAKVRRAIQRGALIPQPCVRCGTTEKVNGHHEDYSKPLEVVWLCPFDHRERHAEMRVEARRLKSENVRSLAMSTADLFSRTG